jgi:acetamidase/formamidase
MVVAAEIGLIKQANFSFPRFETEGQVSRQLDDKGYWATTGVGPDLMQAAIDAVSGMIDWICAITKMDTVDAYMLCSVCADLRISEIVDAPNWTVSLYFPKMVLR